MSPSGPSIRRRARHGRVHQLEQRANASDWQVSDRVDRQDRRLSGLPEPRRHQRRNSDVQVVGHEHTHTERERRRIHRTPGARAVQDVVQCQDQKARHYSHRMRLR